MYFCVGVRGPSLGNRVQSTNRAQLISAPFAGSLCVHFVRIFLVRTLCIESPIFTARNVKVAGRRRHVEFVEFDFQIIV
jgi:hypothetical protein